ncbi:hypothetical protein BC939DRAFT_88667 [Gamsiella multidivaricata]|uniref:uncharacterized protein n=1 Tax=Gamsiella multidivaricata TaxID=101098 RepID=UPI00221F4FBF|nr:uncharacterized protein BC939DRAFT_88667 [Gamsiella multidivaricata]KAI7815772.1 hypothetical protein BC939DRAFT_88667 [Gamsiella multidivaricata]
MRMIERHKKSSHSFDAFVTQHPSFCLTSLFYVVAPFRSQSNNVPGTLSCVRGFPPMTMQQQSNRLFVIY